MRLDARIENGHDDSLALPGYEATCDSTGRETVSAKTRERFRINFDRRQRTLDWVRVAGTGTELTEVCLEQSALRDTHGEELVDLAEWRDVRISERLKISEVVFAIVEVDN